MFDDHAQMQSAIRGIDREEARQNLMDPSKMFFAREQEARGQNQQEALKLAL